MFPLSACLLSLIPICCTHLLSAIHLLCVLSHSVVSDSFVTLWIETCQASLSMGLSRQEYWSELPCLLPGDHPDPGMEPMSPVSPALQVDSLPAEPFIFQVSAQSLLLKFLTCFYNIWNFVSHRTQYHTLYGDRIDLF